MWWVQTLPELLGLLHEAFYGVQVALAHADRLMSAGLQPSSIGIIAPYNAQVKLRLGRLDWLQAPCQRNVLDN